MKKAFSTRVLALACVGFSFGSSIAAQEQTTPYVQPDAQPAAEARCKDHLRNVHKNICPSKTQQVRVCVQGDQVVSKSTVCIG